MAKTAYKITNKVTAAVVFVEAEGVDSALDAMAKTLGAERFSDLKDAAFGDPLPRNLFDVSRGYWKSNNLRGRFSSKDAAIAACAKKDVRPRFLNFWHVGTELV